MALQLDAQAHEILVLRLRQWAAEHYGRVIAADVIVGPRSTRVAEGRIADIQEHPARPGVYRVLFDSHLDPAATESGQDAVLFGWEVTDVTPTPTTLDIAKGTAQRIVLTDLTGQTAVTGPPAVAPAPPMSTPPPAAPAPVATPRRRERPGAGRVLLYVAAAFAVAFAIFVLTRDDTPVVPPVDTQAAPLSEFSAVERRLLGHVPWRPADCRPNAARGAVAASVVCAPAGEKATVRYDRYASAGQLERTWERLRARRNESGSGATDREYGTWCTIAIGECRISDGFYVLFRQDGRATAQWTHTELRIMATATREDGRLAALRGFWQRSGPSE